MERESPRSWWAEMVPEALEALRMRIEAGDVDALRLFFDLEGESLMDAGEVALFFGVSEQTVRNWHHNGTLQGIKIGSTKNAPLRFDERDLHRFVEERRMGGENVDDRTLEAG